MTAMFEPSGTLADIIPEERWAFERLLLEAHRLGYDVEIASVGRTCATQNAIARTPASSASGCQSWHVLGRAVDLVLTPGGCGDYARLGAFWERLGGFWGGRWSQYGPCGDAGHFHMPEPTGPRGSPGGCPADPSACESYRQSYLSAAFRPRYGVISAVLLGVAAAGAVLWWRRRR